MEVVYTISQDLMKAFAHGSHILYKASYCIESHMYLHIGTHVCLHMRGTLLCQSVPYITLLEISFHHYLQM